MYTIRRNHIESANRELGLASQEFHALPIQKWQEVQRKIEHGFLEKTSDAEQLTWYWTQFRQPSVSLPFPGRSYEQLAHLLNEHSYWFFVNETVNELPKFWFYEGTVSAITRIIAETIGLDEYYIASKKMRGLLCVNHHDILIATGKTFVNAVEKLKRDQ